MICSNCGKDGPFGGKVCPWCHADKSGDQAVMATGVLSGFLVFALIAFITHDPCQASLYGIGGGVAGGIAAMFAKNKKP